MTFTYFIIDSIDLTNGLKNTSLNLLRRHNSRSGDVEYLSNYPNNWVLASMFIYKSPEEFMEQHKFKDRGITYKIVDEHYVRKLMIEKELLK